MKIKLFAIGTGLMLALMLVNAPVINAQQEVEPGMDGLTDFSTNINNIKGFASYVMDTFSLFTDYIEAFPDNAGLTAGFYLSILSSIGYIVLMIVFMVVLIVSAILTVIPILGWIACVLILFLMIPISNLVTIILGVVGLIGGYFVYSNAAEGGIIGISGIVQMVGSGLQMTWILAPYLGWPIQIISLILQLLGILGVI